MDVSLSFQLITVGVSVAVGFALGVFRMLLGVAVSVFGRNRVFTFVCDILSFVFAAFVTYCIFLIFTYGNIRGYVLCFEFLGLIIYCLTLGRIKSKVEKIVHLKSKALMYVVKTKVKEKFKTRKNRNVSQADSEQKNAKASFFKKFTKKRKKMQKNTCKN